MKILIVDDEQPARRKLRAFLRRESARYRLFEAKNGTEAVAIIREQQPELVFLDIHMPGMSGFEVIETIGVDSMPAVVFVTAYDQHAIAAFEVQAIDYLLKPFDRRRFLKSFRRAQQQIALHRENRSVLENLVRELQRELHYVQRILVSSGARHVFVKVNDIAFISAAEKYVELHTEQGTFLVRETMRGLEQRLDPSKFARIHRSHIVNIECIKEMQPWSHGDYVALLTDGTRLPISRRYRDRLFGKI